MKNIFVVVFLLLSCRSNAQSYEHIFELRGLEDIQGNTHLFYRYGGTSDYWFSCWSKSIFHFDLQNNIDSLFVLDQGSYIYPYGCMGTSYNDYEFYGNDPTKFICVGFEYNVDPWVAILRYDGPVYVLGGTNANEVEIKSQNQNFLYMTVDESALFKSVDGGLNWTINQDSLAGIDYAMLSISKNDDVQIYGIDNSNLVRSEDEGFSYIIVDNSDWSDNADLFYDSDGNHINSLSVDYDYFNNVTVSKISVSDDNGNPFTWNNILEYEGKVRFTNDEYFSGEIYYSIGNKIFKSIDFGNSFLIYKQLDRNITGLYKKSGTNILYSSTPLKIYEITPDTVQIIKSLPIPEEVLSFYPLSVGNKWVFHHSTVTYDPYPNYSYQIDVKEVLGDTIAPNGRHYYKVNDETIWESDVLERVDSTDGKVYRYYEDPTLSNEEYVAYDLLAEAGDTISSYRMGFNTVMFTTIYAETSFEKWGLIKPKKVFEEYTLHPPIFSITQDVGLDSIYSYFDFGETYITLKGCIIDGIVYGDTTTVGVEDEKNPIATSFKLEQNYPNPFNPRTNIQYAIGSRQFVTLKVYDVLGTEIAILVNEEKPAGEYEVEFNSHSDEGQNLSSGIYFYQLVIRGSEIISEQALIQTKKMILLK